RSGSVERDQQRSDHVHDGLGQGGGHRGRAGDIDGDDQQAQSDVSQGGGQRNGAAVGASRSAGEPADAQRRSQQDQHAGEGPDADLDQHVELRRQDQSGDAQVEDLAQELERAREPVGNRGTPVAQQQSEQQRQQLRDQQGPEQRDQIDPRRRAAGHPRQQQRQQQRRDDRR